MVFHALGRYPVLLLKLPSSHGAPGRPLECGLHLPGLFHDQELQRRMSWFIEDIRHQPCPCGKTELPFLECCRAFGTGNGVSSVPHDDEVGSPFLDDPTIRYRLRISRNGNPGHDALRGYPQMAARPSRVVRMSEEVSAKTQQIAMGPFAVQILDPRHDWQGESARNWLRGHEFRSAALIFATNREGKRISEARTAPLATVAATNRSSQGPIYRTFFHTNPIAKEYEFPLYGTAFQFGYHLEEAVAQACVALLDLAEFVVWPQGARLMIHDSEDLGLMRQ